MLSQFSVKNYKSIRDQITLDMQPATVAEHAEHIIRADSEQEFLPIAVIYGPNGGGKSNVLEALRTLDTIVLRPIHSANRKESLEYKLSQYPVEPFAFSEESKQDSTDFEIYFSTNIAEYRYNLHIQREKIIYEKLDRIKFETNRRSSLYERKNGDIRLTGEFQRLKVADSLSDGLPLLSYFGIMYMNNEVVADVVSWFENGIDFINYGNPLAELRTAIVLKGEIKDIVLDMIKEMDLDIEDFRVEKHDNDSIEVFTRHVVDNSSIELTLSEESSGTRKIFGLLPFIVSDLLSGATLVIDELDAKIHPILLRYIITLFTDLGINKNGAQLIFTSHDLSTMNNELFRRDEIWFVAKGNMQNSMLYSLVEFKTKDRKGIQKDANFDKQYLEGRYGADPYLKRIINWSEINEEKN